MPEPHQTTSSPPAWPTCVTQSDGRLLRLRSGHIPRPSSELDEVHGYKNLRTVSNIQGVGIEGSQRATDLDMKLNYLRARHGGRVATFATATPIANSVSEAFTAVETNF